MMVREIKIPCPWTHTPTPVSRDPSCVGSRLYFSELPGFVLETPDTALFHAWNAHGHGCSWNCRSREMCFSRVWDPPVSGSAMETHIPSHDLEAQAGNFQLSAAVSSDPLPRTFQPHENPSRPPPMILSPLSGAEKERGAPAEWCVGMGFLLGWLEIPLQNVCQNVSIWSFHGGVFNF